MADDDWEDDYVSPKPAPKLNGTGNDMKKLTISKPNDDEWDDDPKPSRGMSNGWNNNVSKNKPVNNKNNDNDWDDNPPPPSNNSRDPRIKQMKKVNNDDWEDDPPPSSNNNRGTSNGWNNAPKNNPVKKPSNEDDWDDDPPPPSNNRGGSNGWNNTAKVKPMNKQNNDDDWNDDPPPAQNKNGGWKNSNSVQKNNKANDDDWDDDPQPSTSNGYRGGNNNRNNNSGWNNNSNKNDDWDDQSKGSNGKRSLASTNDDWDDEAPTAKSARNGWNDSSATSSSFNKSRGPRKPDWLCSQCNAKVFGSKSNCYKCGADKGDSKDAPPDSGNGNRKSDWICSQCSAKVFGSKSNCFKCGADKGDSKDAPPDSGNGNRKSDWICSQCSAKVFGSKSNCFKCGADKGDSKDAPSDSGGNQSRERSNPFSRSNGERNQQSNNDDWGEPSEDKKPERSKRPGDWDCSCGHSNWASRDKCQKCDSDKPEGAGAVEGEPPKERYIPKEENEEELFANRTSTGINFGKFNKIPVEVIDSARNNAPKPIESFEKSGLNELILKNVIRSGYTVPTPIQKHAISIVLNKRDMMACAQTGSGKTAAFLLPIIQTLLAENVAANIGSPSALILTPTRELTTQIFNEARKYASGSPIKICQIYGGTVSGHQRDILNKGCHILVATPGRLIDFVGKSFVEFDRLRFLVFDEADRMLDMGFQDKIETMMNHPTMKRNKERQTLMFSATFPDDICHLAGQYLNEQVFLKVGMIGGACADVQQEILKIGRFEKRAKLLELLSASDGAGGTLVFVEQKKTADFLASFLSEKDIRSTSIHGDRLQSQREEALRDFKTNRMNVLLATAVAARGLDIPNVKHVINFDLPKTIDEYIHRIGRTARIGNTGKATSFFDSDRETDQALAKDLRKVLKMAEQPIPDFLECGGFGDDDENEPKPSTSAAPPAHNGADDDDW